jgi:preprotein translocase subunit SecY
MMMNPEEMSKKLNENGGYIPGIRPGKNTEEHITYILNRITFVGVLFLVIVAGLPVFFSNLTGLPAHVTVGGTGILIVVGVAIEAYKQIESSLLQRSYTSKKKRLR